MNIEQSFACGTFGGAAGKHVPGDNLSMEPWETTNK